MNLSAIDEDESYHEEDAAEADLAKIDESRMNRNETKMEVIYNKLINFKQFN